MSDYAGKIRQAWIGRVSGCQLGKPVERLSMREGYDALYSYFESVGALPVRDYIEYQSGSDIYQPSCRGFITRSEPDDDINYSLLALMLLEAHGNSLTTSDVARAWLTYLPAAQTYTAERAAYKVLLSKGGEWFAETGNAGFDLAECADNPYNDWIGAQIRADVYGWVCPGNPEEAVRLAAVDASLSHRDAGVHGAVFVAALGAMLLAASPDEALESAKQRLPIKSEALKAVSFAEALVGDPAGGVAIRKHYEGMSPVHTLNNLAIVVWALFSHLDDFSAAIGEAVAAGLDTDCNGATVGALWGLQGKPIPERWYTPWQGRIGVSLAGFSELLLDELVERTVRVADAMTA